MANTNTLAEALAQTNAKQQEAFNKGGAHARNKPVPPDGRYNNQIIDVDHFTTDDKDDNGNPTGDTFVNLRVTFKVMDGDREGMVWEQTFWGNSEYDMGKLIDLAGIVLGSPPSDYNAAVLGVAGGKDSVVVTTIARKPSKSKPGMVNTYVNFVG